MREDIEEILLTEQQIAQRLDELGAQLQRDYAGRELTLVAVLTGSVVFVADLLRRLALPVRLDCLRVSSYHGEQSSSGEVAITNALRLDVRERDVLVIDDILDTGLTLVRIRELLSGMEPRTLKFGVFLEKQIPHHDSFRADYVAFRIPNRFVVGYGLDYREGYRNLPYVGTLKPAVYDQR